MSADQNLGHGRNPTHPDDVGAQTPPEESRPYTGSMVHTPQVSRVPPMPAMPRPLKETGVAWLLLVFLGGIGGHDFYLRSPGIGTTKLVLGLLSGLLTFVFIGYIGIFAIFVWNVVDAFRMSGRLHAVNAQIWHHNQALTGHH